MGHLVSRHTGWHKKCLVFEIFEVKVGPSDVKEVKLRKVRKIKFKILTHLFTLKIGHFVLRHSIPLMQTYTGWPKKCNTVGFSAVKQLKSDITAINESKVKEIHYMIM